MEKRFKFNFFLVILGHAILIFLVIYFGHLIMSKPKSPEKIAWLSPGVINAHGQLTPVKQDNPTPPTPEPPARPAPTEPVPAPPTPEPPTPTPKIEKPAPTPPPKTPPPTPKPTPKKPTPAPIKPTPKSSDLNVAPKPVLTPPAPKKAAPQKPAPEAKPKVPVIKKSETIVRKTVSAPATTTSEKSSDPAPAKTAAPSFDGLESIAKKISSSSAAKSGVPSSLVIGTSGVIGGQDSDFSDYFSHIRDRMTQAWDQPSDELSKGKKLKTGVRIKISRNGTISSVSLASSSGNSTWDDSALSAARRAGKVNALPEGLGDTSGLTLTVYFEPES